MPMHVPCKPLINCTLLCCVAIYIGLPNSMSRASRQGFFHDVVLGDISRGLATPSLAQRYATAVVADGGRKPGNSSLARLGAHGKEMSHVRRDLHSHARREYAFMQQLQIYEVDVDFMQKDGLGQCTKKVSLYLPHDLFATLYMLGLFDKVFGTDAQRAAYWASLRAPWWNETHPS